MNKGVLMFAHNNSEIDYFRMAVVNALLVKRHLGVPVCVVTDRDSYEFALENLGEDVIDSAISTIKFVDTDHNFRRGNTKIYRDTVHKQKKLPFYNINRCDAYDLSPFEQTLLIDTDYMILSDTLNTCWDNKNPFMMNYAWQDINFERKLELSYVNPASITMYWATVVYFTRDEFSENFFTLCKHVRKNIDYYRGLYRWPESTYRNDYVFSVAGHMINGLQDRSVPQLPTTLYKTFDFDDVHSINNDHEIVMYMEKVGGPGEFNLCKWSDNDLHVMNKWALNRISGDLLEMLT